jgi:16S rRNA (uracil1498-N3)-methyltransferase
LRVRRRFFVERFEGSRAALRGEAAHHLGRVLRGQPGQLYELSDGERVFLGRVERVGREAIEFVLLERVPAATASLEVTLLLAVVKFDHFEWALEKATELGVTRIVPLAAARSEKVLVSAAMKRSARWQKILLEASQQSRRLRPPDLGDLQQPAKAFAGHRSVGMRLLLSERPNARPMRQALKGRSARGTVLAVGPEGGWTAEEFHAAEQADFLEVSLGGQILRTETAVIAGLAVIQYVLGGSDDLD